MANQKLARYCRGFNVKHGGKIRTLQDWKIPEHSFGGNN